MKFAISALLIVTALSVSAFGADETAFPQILRKLILENGFTPAKELYVNPDEGLAPVGKVIFESKKLSLNGNISCQTCHLAKFGSADGIPNAAAIAGKGEGPERLLSGAKLLARNTLPFWGRGAKGFTTFFWDGKVDFSDLKRFSQFGSHPPSEDPLVVAVHLPVVEIREMLDEDQFVTAHKVESAERAKEVYGAIADNLRKFEPQASESLASYLKKPVAQLAYVDYARAIAAFIRLEFRLKETKLERFVKKSDTLSPEELHGGLVFYGKGRCITCHSGPHFSDFKFHAVPFPQLGFGKNGFGVDYGRFNGTLDPKDLYKFRTPPLYNVQKTAPYGHSGSVATMEGAIIAHFDPLRLMDLSSMDPVSRHEFYKRMTLSSETATAVGFLSVSDINDVVMFLKTLSF
ncbi:MAG: methylamine utilization protein MauG [Nitrospira defluvii]|nr:methylamine utilization protein MauG [Nitrospira defluvii]